MTVEELREVLAQLPSEAEVRAIEFSSAQPTPPGGWPVRTVITSIDPEARRKSCTLIAGEDHA